MSKKDTQKENVIQHQIEQNREAWQEVFAVHQQGYQHDLAEDLMDPDHSFLDAPVIEVLRQMDLSDKVVGQFCCNNGRELLSMVKMGAKSGIGFDFAENFTNEGARLAAAADLDARFVTGDIAKIPDEYRDSCDVLLVTAGALTWFADLSTFFRKAAEVLTTNGVLLIHEMHPVCNMLATEDEDEFDADQPEKLVFSYFRQEPWVENSGADYVGGTTYESKTFYSYSHAFEAILSAIARNGIVIDRLAEFDVDVSNSFAQVAGKGIPLSYLLVAHNG